jgi:large subunit ribosomal protein L25
MTNNYLTAVKREDLGKRATKTVRANKQVPAVIYGHSMKENIHITVEGKELLKLCQKEGFSSHVLELTIGKEKHKVLPRDMQFHPVSDAILHVDFLSVKAGETVHIQVPIHYIGKEKSEALKSGGGILNIVQRTMDLICDIEHIPEFIEADISGLKLGESLHLHSVALPKGVKADHAEDDFAIATIVGQAPEEVEEVPAASEVPVVGEEEAAEGETAGETDAEKEPKKAEKPKETKK